MRSYPPSIEKAAYKIKTGKLSPVELTQAYLARANESQPKFNAFVLITAKSAQGGEDRRTRNLGR